MQVGRVEVGVAVVVRVAMVVIIIVVMVMVMVMVMVVVQQPGADEVHDQTHHRDAAGLQEIDVLRMDETVHGFRRDQHRDDGQ